MSEDRTASDEDVAHLFSAVSEVAARLEAVLVALVASVPEVNLNSLVDSCVAVVTAPGELSEAWSWPDDRFSDTTLTDALWLVESIGEYVRESVRPHWSGPRVQRTADDLSRVLQFTDAAQAELRHLVTIIGLPLGLFPIKGLDPASDVAAAPPTVRQLRLMADRGIECGGHGTMTYAQLADHFSWYVPEPLAWPTPHPQAPLLRGRLLSDVHAVYASERSADDPDPGVLAWLHVVVDMPCPSCQAARGVQCITSTGWRREAHRSHKVRLREARRVLQWHKPPRARPTAATSTTTSTSSDALTRIVLTEHHGPVTAAVRDALGPDLADQVTQEEEWPALRARLVRHHLAGTDVTQLVAEAAAKRELGSADSVAAVLHHRIRGLRPQRPASERSVTPTQVREAPKRD